MILIYEPFLTKLGHVPFNSEFLSIVSMSFPEKQIVFYGETGHIENVRNRVNLKNIEYRSINVIEPKDGHFRSIINERKNERMLALSHREEAELVIVLNSHPHTMFFAKRYFPDETPLMFIIHGNLEELKRKKHFFQLGFWIKPSFRYKKQRTNLKYVVLGDSIRENLLKYVNYIDSNLVAIPHPYSLTLQNNASDCVKDRSIITMGMIGSFSSEKRSNLIFELERRLKSRGVNNIAFKLVGSGIDTVIPKDSNASIVGDGINKLGEKEFNEAISRLDYILFFWPSDSYQLTASGALCDAIIHSKPVVSIRNCYLTWVFDEVGDLGFLCNDINEMEDVVVKIANGKMNERINEIKKNFEKARVFFSKENVLKIMNEKHVWMIK